MIRHRLDAKLPEQLAFKLEKAILAQQYRPGQKLPAERNWAAELGVSRAALREALGMLAERGLLQRRHGAGSFVSERPDERRADPWKQMLQRQPLMQTDLLEFREMLEIRCAELAAQRAETRGPGAPGEGHARSDGRLQQRRPQAPGAGRRGLPPRDCRRHAQPGVQHLVGSLLELLHEHVLISIASLEAESPDVRQLRRQHTRLFERITAHDAAGAAQAARAHIAFVRRSWQQRLA
jgi:GntR family transcriptional repressor for pyruvate dehydrogenase complex